MLIMLRKSYMKTNINLSYENNCISNSELKLMLYGYRRCLSPYDGDKSRVSHDVSLSDVTPNGDNNSFHSGQTKSLLSIIPVAL